MSFDPTKIDFRSHFIQQLRPNKFLLYTGTGIVMLTILLAISFDAWGLPIAGGTLFFVFQWLDGLYKKPYKRKLRVIEQPFSTEWQQHLQNHSFYYQALSEAEKQVFNTRVQLFLDEKRIVGVETTIDDLTRLLVAASAIIPTFAFPYFEYPNVNEIVVYPNSFDENFQTEGPSENGRRILGMVGNRFLNNTVLLSKPDLMDGFRGKADKQNVGIHEFVHLIDKADGVIDGLPELLLDHQYSLPWLEALKEETQRMRRGQSDIHPYGLTNDAEFLAVVSEYFFDNPAKFNERHPALYQLLSRIYHQETDRRKKRVFGN